jgi:hypothetical protein
MIPTLIYCGGGNPRFYEIAKSAGFMYGAQLPSTVYGPLYFADQNWKRPDRTRYLCEIAKHKPYMASVLDWERSEQLPEVLEWAEDIAPHVRVIMIIPKVQNEVERLPRVIGGRPVRLGYSVPTKFGGTSLMSGEFDGWPVHLLGGSPHAQRIFALYLNVVSVDGNMHQMMATRYCAFWTNNPRRYKRGRWPTLIEADGHPFDGDGPAEAFRRSCENIRTAWGLPSPAAGNAT